MENLKHGVILLMKIKIFSVLRGTFMEHGDVIVLSTGISQTFGFTNWDFFKEFKVRLWAWRAILLLSISSSLWHEAIKSDATPPMKELLIHPRVVTPSAFCRFLGQFVGNHYCSWCDKRVSYIRTKHNDQPSHAQSWSFQSGVYYTDHEVTIAPFLSQNWLKCTFSL